MSIESALRTFLLDDATVAGLVGTRIYPQILPQNPTYPALSFQRVSAVRLRALDGVVGVAQARFQIDCWALTYAQCRALASAVRVRLDGYRGDMDGIHVGATTLENDQDIYEDDVTGYRASLDVIIQHQE